MIRIMDVVNFSDKQYESSKGKKKKICGFHVQKKEILKNQS